MKARTPAAIENRDARMRADDNERNDERRLRTHSSAISLLGIAVGLLGHRRWLIVPLIVQGVLLRDSLRGPSMPGRIALDARARARSRR